MSKFVRSFSIISILSIMSFCMISCEKKSTETLSADITFENASVHDPAILKVDDTYYITGSHMAEAKSTDLINWTNISYTVKDTKLFNNIKEELKEALEWGDTNTFWASDWIKLNDGRYYLYYCVCEGSSPQGAIGYAVCDDPNGPYENLGLLVKSSGKDPLEYEEADGEIGMYDANIHPNAIDPAVFYDAEGKLWMMYGSYSGGIYILELDANTGKVLDGQGTYGKKILGGYHSEIEAPYVIYSPETKYYYLFLSYGGLTSDAGYNMRVCRSENPDGPYYDAMGNDMLDCKGLKGKFLEAQNVIIEEYGNKMFGNFKYPVEELEENEILDPTEEGYVSAGHNSVYYDEENKQYFLIFHTRFPSLGETHQVRVHQMFLNEDGWFVVSPYRYAGEEIEKYSKDEVVGSYSFINHGREITKEIKEFEEIELKNNGEIEGAVKGTWKFKNKNEIVIKINNETYSGVFLRQYNPNKKEYTMTFTVMGKDNGTALWGIKK